ncbi:hypothetical protein C5167_039740 [Papaver somniferum]|uniref:Phosphomannomutase n=1 Tax=Papaver somniferum TaxID=3469 RepID=A0A4Y7IGG1_PAPSO|nr:hypothetical protein C5167_039740 [Papaver somniferum]
MSFVVAILKFIEEFRLRLNVAFVAASDFAPITAPIASEFINFTLHYIADLISQSKGITCFSSYCFNRRTSMDFRNGMINVSPIGQNCSQKERDDFEKYYKIHNVRPKMGSVFREKFAHLNLTFSVGGQINFDVSRNLSISSRLGQDLLFEISRGVLRNSLLGDKIYKGGNNHEIYELERTVWSHRCLHGGTPPCVYMLVHLALALRASMEEDRPRKDDAARAAEEK